MTVIDPVNRDVVCPVAVRFACHDFLGAALADALVTFGFGLGVELVGAALDAQAAERQTTVARRA